MDQLKQSLNENIQKVEDMIDDLYHQNNQLAYEKLIKVVDSLNEIIVFISEMDVRPRELDEACNKLAKDLKEAMSALIEKDTILLADIFNYEIKGTLSNMIEVF